MANSTEFAYYTNVMRSCTVLYFHFSWGLFMVLWGILTITARLPVEWIRIHMRPWHAALGQFWMYGTIIQMATSLWCRSDGFNTMIFSFLVILVLNMIIGHASIRVYQRGMNQQVIAQLKQKVQEGAAENTSGASAFEIGDSDASVFLQGQQTVCGLPLIRFKQLHGVCMCLCYSMLFGAGIAFSTRSKQLKGCTNFYAKHHGDAVSVGSVIFELGGALVLGGHNFTEPGQMLATEF